MDLSTHHWHFIGIGGAGMSALAEALLDLGASVSGSDLAESDATRSLQRRGARIFAGHQAENLGDADKVVVTAAVSESNPELRAAHELGLPIVARAALLGQLMDMRQGVAVAGTHGKTTTSSMLAWVFSRAGRDPSYMVGGTIRGLGAGGRWGGGEALVAEADEYNRSFLQLHPQVGIILNIDNDHLEYYGSPEAIYTAFSEFAGNVRPGGLLVMCADDPTSAKLAGELAGRDLPFRLQLYGTTPNALWRLADFKPNERGGSDYRALRDGAEAARVSLQVPGRHMALNSLAVLAACAELGIIPEEAARLLADFQGAGRRFEVKGEAGGVTIVDDYAHHPTEIAATLQAARLRYPGRRIVALFQPHTYTRTRDFLPDFARALEPADRVYVTEIYASRERDTLGMSGRMIAERIPGAKAAFVPTLAEVARTLLNDLQPGDVLLTMGAGDVWEVGEAVLSALESRGKGEIAPVKVERHIPEAVSPDVREPGSLTLGEGHGVGDE